MRRSQQRRAAVFALYQHDLTGQPLLGALGPNASLLTRALAHAAADRAEELDAIIDRHAHGWSVTRIQPLERSIMRVALIEMLHPEAAPADTPIPPEGAIEEAVESAKVFCAGEAPGFVNGVLAAVLRDVLENSPIPASDAAGVTQPAISQPTTEQHTTEQHTTDRHTTEQHTTNGSR
ncbi:MAG TPA: transcription antitermination protein NusB [Solirubrobacteraceae bacterium]